MRAFVHDGLPQRLVFGLGRVSEVPAEVERLGRGRSVLLCSWRRERFSEELATLARDLPGVRIFAGAEAHVPRDVVEAAWKEAQEHGADAVVSFGGGSTIDLGKALVYVATHGTEALSEPRPAEPVTDPPLAHLAIPTTYSGAEATVRFGITYREEEEKRGGGGPGVLPQTVVADPALTVALGARATGATGMNAIAHCVEALYSPTRTAVTDALATHASGPLFEWLPVAVERPDDLEARERLLAASYLAGSVLNQAGMGLHHGICHALGGRLGVPHGEANAIVLPHAMRFNLGATREGQGAFARAIGADGPEAAADAVARLVGRLGLPARLREVGVLEGDLEPVAGWCAERSPAVRNNPRPAGASEVLEVLRAAW